MHRIHLIIVQLLLVGMALTFSSCATIFGGSKNTVRVEMGFPEKAEVYLDGELLGEAPFKIRISKYLLQEGSLIEIKKDGFETMLYQVHRTPHIGYVAADVITVVALLIDVADGNIYRPNTRKIEYKLTKLDAVSKKESVKQIKAQEKR